MLHKLRQAPIIRPHFQHIPTKTKPTLYTLICQDCITKLQQHNQTASVLNISVFYSILQHSCMTEQTVNSIYSVTLFIIPFTPTVGTLLHLHYISHKWLLQIKTWDVRILMGSSSSLEIWLVSISLQCVGSYNLCVPKCIIKRLYTC